MTDPKTPNDTDTDDSRDDDQTSPPAIVDESAFEDDGDDDDDMPLHFDVVASDHAESAAPEAGDRPPPEPEGPPEIPLHLVDADALWVVRRLHAKGYEAYLTGGCVRDLLLGRTPKDFDVATAAHPNQVKAVFRNCRLVGRRFRLAHVFFPSGKVIETATFRANPTDTLEDLPEGDLLVERDNVFGNVEEDARRRDLTVNGLFYDPLKGKVLDYVDGRKDLDARLIRTIGNPGVRFQEDPVRILRAIKFATRLGFAIEDETFAAMKAHVGGLLRCAPARLQEEILRLLASGHAADSLRLCDEVGVTEAILPELGSAFAHELEPRTIVVPVSRPRGAKSAPPPDVTEPPTAAPEAHEQADAVAAEPAEAVEPVEPSAEAGEPAKTSETTLAVVPAPNERHARFHALLRSLDEVKKRDVDITSSVAFAVLLTPVWEAFNASTSPFELWFEETAQKWADRIRLTRHDKERIPQLLSAQDDLLPARRRGQHARSTVTRPSFKEALLLYTLRLHAAGASLEDVGLWKVVAQAAGAPYRQPRLSERGPRQRAAGRGAGGGGNSSGGGRGRGRDRGRRGRR